MLLPGHLEIIIPRSGSGYGEGDTPAALFRACWGQSPSATSATIDISQFFSRVLAGHSFSGDQRKSPGQCLLVYGGSKLGPPNVWGTVQPRQLRPAPVVRG